MLECECSKACDNPCGRKRDRTDRQPKNHSRDCGSDLQDTCCGIASKDDIFPGVVVEIDGISVFLIPPVAMAECLQAPIAVGAEKLAAFLGKIKVQFASALPNCPVSFPYTLVDVIGELSSGIRN
ncbi:hypothetical protein FEJ81_21020 (plasmid) [Natrinema versiforme]|uniref:Uncharacterized protein n=1 Tax=Natrinema versiforme TaxID=88724 RepID=A0A4P8WMX3_9EURY|nr:hypothetical protein FEJ81_21020 [Natrinema versiforme]